MLRIIVALIVFAIADDACAKETVTRTHISPRARNVMRVIAKYSAIQQTKPRPKLRVDND